ncbi:hypothetical protein AHAS_Ahas16G0229200 [Arachis hypogaea]
MLFELQAEVTIEKLRKKAVEDEVAAEKLKRKVMEDEVAAEKMKRQVIKSVLTYLIQQHGGELPLCTINSLDGQGRK